jgi:hypothetical protein
MHIKSVEVPSPASLGSLRHRPGQRQATTARVDEVTGTRHCKCCYKHGLLLGGNEALDSRGRTKWLCAMCLARLSRARQTKPIEVQSSATAKTEPSTQNQSIFRSAEL